MSTPNRNDIYAPKHAKLVKRARAAARDAFLNDRYGNGKHDWQSALVAAHGVLQDAGMSISDADEIANEIGSEVVSEEENKMADEYESECER